MAFDVGRNEWASRDDLQIFPSGVVQSGFCQIAGYSLSLVLYRYFGVEQIEPAIGLRVINLCDLLSEGSFKAMGSFVSAYWVISHSAIMT